MNPTALALLGLQAANAQQARSSFNDLLNGVQGSLNNIWQKADAWSASQGIAGALGIQRDVPQLLEAVNALRTAAGIVTDEEIDPQAISALVAGISGMLQSIARKQGDFQQVGARTIGGNDISQLEQPTIDIMTGVIRATQGDCGKQQQLSPIVNQAAQAFTNAASFYGNRTLPFPMVPACQNHANLKQPQHLIVHNLETKPSNSTRNQTVPEIMPSESPVSSTWPEASNRAAKKSISFGGIAIVVALFI